ncbi:MAG: transposase [Desulfobacterales bacterium]|nr:transposase [Desulfobacterales bacterium]
MVNPFEKFTIANISRKLNQINPEISLSHQNPFPNLSLLSHYEFKKRFVKIMPNGDIQGGYAKMIISLINFSFIRSLVAHCYSAKGPPCYDPPSIFLLDLFRYLDGFQNMRQFLELLRDKDRGRAYRKYAGISMDNIPCEGTFSNFRARLGENLYNEIFHVLVGIFHQLQMITFKILAHDGTLYPTWARYKGCTYFCDQCASITVENVIGKVRNQILYRLNNLSNNNLGSEIRVKAPCPSHRFPEKNKNGKEIKRPRIELFACRLAFADGELSEEQKNTAILFGVEDELRKQNLCIQTIRSNVFSINFEDESITISCPKLPKDTDARIGVRRNPKNPNKKEKIFGYNLVLSTSVEVQLKIELPVAVTNIAGNAEEGSQIIQNKEQVHNHHHTEVKVDIADAKYDIINNYNYIRSKGSIPIIDYNRRREDLSKTAILKRGYDQNGWPFAPCGLLARPNGFDQKNQRLTFCCFKQCLKLRRKALQDLQALYSISQCPHIKNQTGYARHMYIKEHPRLVNEIPRGTKRYNTIKNMRSASERANSTIKEDIRILEKPRVVDGPRANILAQMAGIVLLLKRAFSFIAKITNRFRKLFKTNDPAIKEKLKPPFITKSIRNIIQLE